MEAGPAPQDVAEIARRRASATAVKFVPPPQTPPKPSGSPLAAGDPARPETRTLRTRGLAATSEDLVRQQPLQACKIVQKALPNLILKLHAGNHSESAGRSPAKLLWGTGRASRRDPPRPVWRRHCLDYSVSPEEPAPAYPVTTMVVGIPTACPNAKRFPVLQEVVEEQTPHLFPEVAGTPGFHLRLPACNIAVESGRNANIIRNAKTVDRFFSP